MIVWMKCDYKTPNNISVDVNFNYFYYICKNFLSYYT